VYLRLSTFHFSRNPDIRGSRTPRKRPFLSRFPANQFSTNHQAQAMEMTSSTKQSVLITGCSKGGIGDALAQEFYSRGFLVFATARNLAKIQHLKDLGCEILALDVTDENSIEHAVQYVTKKNGGVLHYLINNAGMGKY
jgi:hypothetical protein